MKSRETKQKDLDALTESLQKSKSAMVVSFSKLTVTKDQEFRHNLREAGANYQVVKNTLAKIAVKGTQFEDASEYFKGVTAIAWTDNDPVVLTKTISKFLKDNSDVYNFKTGVLDGKVIDFTQLQSIASLPSKEELISKLLWVLNSSAQRIVTVINAVPRNLAVVIKQIGDQKEAPVEAKAEAAPAPVSEVESDAAAQAVAEEAASPETEASAPVVAQETESLETESAGATLDESHAIESADEQPSESAVETAPADEMGAQAEQTASAPDDAAAAITEPASEDQSVETEAAAEEAAAIPGDKAEEILEIGPETHEKPE